MARWYAPTCCRQSRGPAAALALARHALFAHDAGGVAAERDPLLPVGGGAVAAADVEQRCRE